MQESVDEMHSAPAPEVSPLLKYPYEQDEVSSIQRAPSPELIPFEK